MSRFRLVTDEEGWQMDSGFAYNSRVLAFTEAEVMRNYTPNKVIVIDSKNDVDIKPTLLEKVLMKTIPLLY